MDKNEMMKTEIFITEKGRIGFGECDDMSGQDTFREQPCLVLMIRYTQTATNYEARGGSLYACSECYALCEDRSVLNVTDRGEADKILKKIRNNKKKLKYRYKRIDGIFGYTEKYVREDVFEEFMYYYNRVISMPDIITLMSNNKAQG